MTKHIFILAPVRDQETIKAKLAEQYPEYNFAYADSFAEALMKNSDAVIVFDPVDKPMEGVDVEINIQLHDMEKISQLTSSMLNDGLPDSEVTNLNRRMFAYSKLTTSLQNDAALNIINHNCPIDDYGFLQMDYWAKPSSERGQTEATQTLDDSPFQEDKTDNVDADKKDEQPDPEEPDPETKIANDLNLADQVAEVKQDVENKQPETLNEFMAKHPPIEPEKTETVFDTDKSTATYLGEITDLKINGKPIVTEEVKQPESPVDAKVSNQESTNEVPFDPFVAAMDNGIEIAASETNQDALEDKTDVKADPKEDKDFLARAEAENYPKVDMTVTINPKIFAESKNADAPAILDWGGSPKTYDRVFNGINNKINFYLSRDKEPKLTPFEQRIANIANDTIANEEVHSQQYVEGARWDHTVNTPTSRVPIITPIKNPDYGDSKYAGPDSVALLQNRMKIGCKLGVFLPHTGLYFIINSPSDSELLDTLSIVNNYRVEALRESSGILLGNSNFYLYRQVINLFVNNITGCSLAGWNKENIQPLFDERDINIIATALMASIYPDGYEYRQSCGIVKDNKTCEAEIAKLVDLRRMIFVDNSRLSETQRNLAAGGLRERSINEIKTYQDTNYLGYKKPYEITEGVSFVYKSQKAAVVIEAGEKWIKEIEAIVDSIITFNQDEETRNTMIRQRINLTRIREFSHWVEEIHIDETNVITDRTKINDLLNSLSRNQEVMDKVSETLSEFQRLASIAIVAIPRVQCSVCKQTETKDLDICTHLIPQDAVSRLFTLARQRL